MSVHILSSYRHQPYDIVGISHVTSHQLKDDILASIILVHGKRMQVISYPGVLVGSVDGRYNSVLERLIREDVAPYLGSSKEAHCGSARPMIRVISDAMP
ncbi:predicted protein [Histoplasma capsulatum H143]|uniref:Uncharacterized protein n=1 Tax=Ajellomyces capsulatus (strain H143) TaxID=544712 RepID=C6HIL2_AJECH|nr:predicted protein [Histoplasma capsulatum H143]